MAVSSHDKIDLASAMVLDPVALADWLIIAPVVWCMVLGALLLCIRKHLHVQAVISVVGFALNSVFSILLLIKVLENGPVMLTMGRWLAPFGITFTVDLLSAVLTVAASIVALACAVFSVSDINGSDRRYGFYTFFFLMMAGVNGAFLTGDIFNLYVWFEVLLISSFGLLVLGSKRAQLDGAVKYALLNLIATTLFLIATGYLYGVTGTLNMADIAVKVVALRETTPVIVIASMYLLAFGMKAAAFPANFWLPASYHTPKLVVSALFAGLLTKVGIYALLRTMFLLFPVERGLLGYVIAVVAATTMITAAFGALAQNDVRRTLGYLVITGIGMMLAGVSLASNASIAATIFYALHSIVVICALYMCVGLAAKAGGGFTLSQMAGVYKAQPLLSAIMFVLMLAVAGLPPFTGFWPKVMLVKAALDVGVWWLAAAVLITGILTTIAVGRIWLFGFWQKSEQEDSPALNAPINSFALYPLIFLTLLLVGFGLFPQSLMESMFDVAEQLLNNSTYIGTVFPGELVK